MRSRDSSALHPDFKILWKVSIFQRMAYQLNFSIALRHDATDKSVISFHSMRFRFNGSSRSRACITVPVLVLVAGETRSISFNQKFRVFRLTTPRSYRS